MILLLNPINFTFLTCKHKSWKSNLKEIFPEFIEQVKFDSIPSVYFSFFSSLHVLLVRIGESTQGDGIHAIRARELAARQTGYLQPSWINFKRERRFRNLPLLLLSSMFRDSMSRGFNFWWSRECVIEIVKILGEIDIVKLSTIFWKIWKSISQNGEWNKIWVRNFIFGWLIMWFFKSFIIFVIYWKLILWDNFENKIYIF